MAGQLHGWPRLAFELEQWRDSSHCYRSHCYPPHVTTAVTATGHTSRPLSLLQATRHDRCRCYPPHVTTTATATRHTSRPLSLLQATRHDRCHCYPPHVTTAPTVYRYITVYPYSTTIPSMSVSRFGILTSAGYRSMPVTTICSLIMQASLV